MKGWREKNKTTDYSMKKLEILNAEQFYTGCKLDLGKKSDFQYPLENSLVLRNYDFLFN